MALEGSTKFRVTETEKLIKETTSVETSIEIWLGEGITYRN